MLRGGLRRARNRLSGGALKVGDRVIKRGEYITLDGSTGEVMAGRVPTVKAEMLDHFRKFMRWADQERDLGVRANADTPATPELRRNLAA